MLHIKHTEEKLKFQKKILSGLVEISQLDSALFTGDTLFNGGVGKFFEGTAFDMAKNLDLIKQLDTSTKIF